MGGWVCADVRARHANCVVEGPLLIEWLCGSLYTNGLCTVSHTSAAYQHRPPPHTQLAHHSHSYATMTSPHSAYNKLWSCPHLCAVSPPVLVNTQTLISTHAHNLSCS